MAFEDIALSLPFSFIQPCRSLCVAVRDSCAPVLACQGHLWPEALDCDRFPDEEDMCLTPYAKLNHYSKGKKLQTCYLNVFSSTFSLKNCIVFTYYLNLIFNQSDVPKPACQNCPSVEDAPAVKTVLGAFCRHDFGMF